MLLGCLILAGMFFTGVILGEDAVTSRDIERDVRQRLDRGELSGDDVDMALSYCEEVFSERQEDVSFLKLYGELLLVGREERGGTDLSSLVLEEAVAVYDRQLRLMQHKALTGQVDEAYHLGTELLQSFPNEYLLNLELGVIQFMRQEFDSAIELCSKAGEISNNSDSQAASCVGVAATHLGLKDIALPALHKAFTFRDKIAKEKSTIFSLPVDAIEYSLIHGLKLFSVDAECVAIASKLLSLPSDPSATAYIILFSAINWTSPSKIARLKILEMELSERYISSHAKSSLSLFDEVKRLQRDYMTLLTPLFGCVRSAYEEIALAALNDLYTIIYDGTSALIKDTPLTQSQQFKSHQQNSGMFGVVLFSQYYEELSAGRDVTAALMKNLINPFISEVWLLNEQHYDFSNMPNAHKINQVIIGRRMKFQDAVDISAAELKGRIIVVDIYFDHSLEMLGNKNMMHESYVHAVSKYKDWWQSSNDTHTLFDIRNDSQDAWIFRSPLNECVSKYTSSFHLGGVGCDNHFAGVLKRCGYHVSNPALFLRASEYSSKERRTSVYSSQSNSCDGKDGAYVLLSDSPVLFGQ